MESKNKRKMGRPMVKDPVCIQHAIRLNKTLDERLKEFCSDNNLTLAVVVREALEEFLNTHEKKGK